MPQSVNILFLGGAKRVSMARLLVAAGSQMGLEVKLFSYELSTEVPVAEVATVVVGCRWNDPGLMADLHKVVLEHRINVLIPFVDPAVEVAVRYCVYNPECWTPGMDAGMAALMFDKVEADTIFRQHGFPLPVNALIGDVHGDVIAKPRCGSASKGVMVLSQEDFSRMKSTDAVRDYLFQEYVGRREEFTVDCYVDRSGAFVCAVPRRRIEVSGGEVMVTETLHDDEIEGWSRRILHELDLRGPVTIQFLREKSGCNPVTGSNGLPSCAGRLMLMEINPRLGGGAVCSVHAGAALPEFILHDWLGHAIGECDRWQPGVKICRYMQEVVFNAHR